MAGIGKLARLLVKGRQILRSPAMKNVSSGAKKVGNAIVLPFKKAHEIQEFRFYAPGGGKLPIGKRLANGALNTLGMTSAIGMLGSFATAVGGLAVSAMSENDTPHKAAAIALKGLDSLVLSGTGFIFGGPIGALAGLAYGIFGDKSPFVNLAGTLEGQSDEAIKKITKDMNTYAKAGIQDLYNDGRELLGLSVEKNNPVEKTEEEQQTQQTSEEETQEEEQVEQTPEQEEETEVSAEQEEQQVQEPEQQQEEEQQPAVEETPPTDNLFGGTLNEISIKQYDVQPKDCLWNIAKRELQKANPGKTVTNAHILQQVKEFIRLNPQIKNPDLIYPNQKIKTAA